MEFDNNLGKGWVAGEMCKGWWGMCKGAKVKSTPSPWPTTEVLQ